MSKYSVIILLICLLITLPAYSQSTAPLITYGPKADISEGDDDYKQIIFFQIPNDITDSIYVRIFDPDCGGLRDELYNNWDSETQFRLFGGAGAFTAPTIKKTTPNDKDLTTGILLADQSFGIDPFLDDNWYTFATVSPTSGEKIGNNYLFKLVVNGISGDEGNIYKVAISHSPLRNALPKGSELFSFTPTVRLPDNAFHAELRFFVPTGNSEITVNNFDGAFGKIAVETRFRSGIEVKPSNQGYWEKGLVQLNDDETGRYSAITLHGGNEIPNDVTFHLEDKSGEPIRIQHPILLHRDNARPIPVVTWAELTDCRSVMFDASNSNDPNGDPIDFFWDFGDGQTGTGEMAIHKYGHTGKFDIELIVSDLSNQIGNSSRKKFTISVNIPPIAVAGVDQVGIPGQVIYFDGSGSKDEDNGIESYRWHLGDGTVKNGMQITHSYIEQGHYDVSLRVIDKSKAPNPCNAETDNLVVWINAPPEVEIGSDLITSIGEPISLSGANCFDSDGKIVSYNWDLGDGATKSGKNITHSYAKAGRYRVNITIEDNAKVANSTATDFLHVFVNDPPIAKANSHRTVVSVGDEIKFDALQSVDPDGKFIYFGWDYGDGAKGEGIKSTHAYAKPGVYTVTLTVRDNSTSKSDTHTNQIDIVVNFIPVARAGDDQLVSESEVQFDARASNDKDGTITEYLWEFGDGLTSAESAPMHVYAHPGTYDVKLTVTDDSKTSTNKHSDNVTIIINERPIADAGPDQIGMPDQTLSFDASGSIDPDGNITKFRWSFGDGGTADGKTVSHSYKTPGHYTVQLTVLDNTSHALALGYDEAKVFINTPPVADAGRDVRIAPGEWVDFDASKSFDNDGKIVSYRWDLANEGKISDLVKHRRKFDKPGIYTATVTVLDNSGANNPQNQDRMTIYVNHEPIANAGKDIHTCELTVSLDGSKSADADGNKLTYYWDFGDGLSGKFGMNVNYTYKKPGMYPVILTVDDGTGLKNAKNSTSITVSINLAPRAFAGTEKTVCAGDVVLFDGSGSVDPEGGLLKYNWDFGDGTTAEGVNPTKTYETGGVYSVTLNVEDDSGLPCNSDVDMIVVRVAESPVANAGEDMIVCANTKVSFDGSKSKDFDGLVNNYNWDFGDGETGGGPTPSHVFSAPGIYLVTLRITGDPVGDCDNTDSDELTVTVHEAPIAQISAPQRAPINNKVDFDASESKSGKAKIIAFKWDFGDSTYSEGNKTSHTYTKAGKYFVSLIVETDAATSCNSTSAKNLIVINDPPLAISGEDQFVGINEIVVFDGSNSSDPDGKITMYEWDFGDSVQSKGVQVRHRYQSAGKYPVTLKVTDDTKLPNNSNIDNLSVTVNATPVPVITYIQKACTEEKINFNGAKSNDSDGQIVSYTWNFGDGETGDSVQVAHAYAKPGVYHVTLTIDDGKKVNNSVVETTVPVTINYPPVAEAGLDQIVCPDQVVSFSGAGSSDRDGKIVAWFWDFGDGTKSEGQSVKHTYKKSGTYKAKLIVTDDSGVDCATSEDDCIVRVNNTPIAVAGPDQDGFFGGAHDEMSFDGYSSSDSDKDPLTYSWKFGDGSSANGPKVSHTYFTPGRYVVKLTVNDGLSTTCSTSQDELIVNIKKH